MAGRRAVLAWILVAAAGIALVALLALALGGSSPAETPNPSGSSRPTSSLVAFATPRATNAVATPRPSAALDPVSGLLTIRRAALPPEALTTLDRIAAGGPFPYRQDGITYRNLEGILPNRPTGYYREYTVETPGSPDRGAKRIVTGGVGEWYWTADHYASFQRILP